MGIPKQSAAQRPRRGGDQGADSLATDDADFADGNSAFLICVGRNFAHTRVVRSPDRWNKGTGGRQSAATSAARFSSASICVDLRLIFPSWILDWGFPSSPPPIGPGAFSGSFQLSAFNFQLLPPCGPRRPALARPPSSPSNQAGDEEIFDCNCSEEQLPSTHCIQFMTNWF